MALIKCPGCGSEISDKADCCPKCGMYFPVKKPMKVCNECGATLNEGERICHSCGFPIEQTNKISVTNLQKINKSTNITKSSMNRKKAARITKWLCIICICVGLFFLGKGFYKKNSYSNPDSDSSYSYSKTYTNSYVGGDAYNYIINGTYFTGYIVLGMGFLIISAMSGFTSIVLSVEEYKDEKDVDNDEKS